jgi:hypothetical protein
MNRADSITIGFFTPVRRVFLLDKKKRAELHLITSDYRGKWRTLHE